MLLVLKMMLATKMQLQVEIKIFVITTDKMIFEMEMEDNNA